MAEDAADASWVPLGSLVEIHGLTEATGGSSAADANGLQGRCTGWVESSQKYTVETFHGHQLEIESSNLQQAVNKGAEAGGFDFCSAMNEDVDGDHGRLISECVARKGYCVIQNFLSNADCMEAHAVAKRLRNFECILPELAEGYLGGDSQNMKVAWLDEDDPDEPLRHSLDRCDRDLTRLGHLISLSATDILGLELWGRSPGLVRMACASRSEEAFLEPEPFESHVEAGLVEKYIEFCKRRQLLMMSVVDCHGGEMLLLPKDSSEGQGGIRIPLSPNKVIIINVNELAYYYRPVGSSLAIQAWLLTEPQMFSNGIRTTGYDDVPGLKAGPPELQALRQTRVLSLCCRLPGDVDGDLQMFTQMLAAGTDGSVQWPENRWSLDEYYADDVHNSQQQRLSYTKHGAFKNLDYIACFDNTFFEIADSVVPDMAPAQRIVLQVGYESIVQAGYTKQSMSGRNIGAYVGDNSGTWDWMSHRPVGPTGKYSDGNYTEHMYAGYLQSITAARLGHFINSKGISRSIDTACSSSLVGINLLQHDFVNGSSEEAVAMGVNTFCSPVPFVMYCAQNMLSSKGRCFTFDAHGDGYARGEGSCGLFFRRSGCDLQRDKSDRNMQLGTLIGCCTNSDGRSASLFAPNGPAQRMMLEHSLRSACIEVDEISAAECHGTGTVLGDPIEIGAIRAALAARKTGPIVLTSRKSNFSHTEADAGAAGVAGVVAMLRLSAGMQTCHLRELNPNLDTAGSTVGFMSELYSFETCASIVGVSSFGVGGSNAHGDFWGDRGQLGDSEGPQSFKNAHYVHVGCPKCLGQMCWVCSASIPTNAAYGKHHCSLVRDISEDYDLCSICYQGNYVCGELIGEEFRRSRYEKLYVIGSRNAPHSMQELRPISEGVFSCVVQLGETRCEQFHIAVGQDGSRGFIFPVVDLAGPSLRVEGPSEDHVRNGRSWLLDGRAAGNISEEQHSHAYKITFEWHGSIKRVFWEAASAPITF